MPSTALNVRVSRRTATGVRRLSIWEVPGRTCFTKRKVSGINDQTLFAPLVLAWWCVRWRELSLSSAFYNARPNDDRRPQDSTIRREHSLTCWTVLAQFELVHSLYLQGGEFTGQGDGVWRILGQSPGSVAG
jgi:hypothetical protein